jgi:hypothetical protein
MKTVALPLKENRQLSGLLAEPDEKGGKALASSSRKAQEDPYVD